MSVRKTLLAAVLALVGLAATADKASAQIVSFGIGGTSYGGYAPAYGYGYPGVGFGAYPSYGYAPAYGYGYNSGYVAPAYGYGYRSGYVAPGYGYGYRSGYAAPGFYGSRYGYRGRW